MTRLTTRFERKYLIDQAQYHQVRNELQLQMTTDGYTRQGGGSYLVRSLYYDTRDFSAFHERSDGNFGRIKLRVRSYCERADPDQPISVEIKTKKGNAMEKFACLVGLNDYLAFQRSLHWACPGNEVTSEFERLYRVRLMVPVLLIQYRREGYRTRDGSPLRVTLDQNVSSARASRLFPEQLLLKPHRPKNVVLEIKSTAACEPEWLQRIVRKHGLKMTANSKYVQGIEIIRPNMVTPRPVA
jgi:SPX domain protein involved in polyphosphate accumulation